MNDVYNTGKGYAFVTMADQDGAVKAITELNGREICGQVFRPCKRRAAQPFGKDFLLLHNLYYLYCSDEWDDGKLLSYDSLDTHDNVDASAGVREDNKRYS